MNDQERIEQLEKRINNLEITLIDIIYAKKTTRDAQLSEDYRVDELMQRLWDSLPTKNGWIL